MECDTVDHRLLPTSGQVVAHAARSVALLHAIESTITVVSSNATIIHSVTHDVIKLIDGIDSYSGDALLDPEGRACHLFIQAAETASRLHRRCPDAIAAAHRDNDLRDDDGVVDAWEDLMAALSDYHNAIEDLRDRILTVDALKSPRGAIYTNVDTLLADLGA